MRLPTKSACRGFSIVSAIFLIVVLAGLGVAMLNIATVQHASSQLDIQGARAYQAARAGIEWGAYQRLILSAACATSPGTTTSFALPASATTLSSFTVTVNCTTTVDTNETPNINVRQITATACNNPSGGSCPNAGAQGPDYVERKLQISFEN